MCIFVTNHIASIGCDVPVANGAIAAKLGVGDGQTNRTDRLPAGPNVYSGVTSPREQFSVEPMPARFPRHKINARVVLFDEVEVIAFIESARVG